jgi:tRNA-dihydrouridine synthase C
MIQLHLAPMEGVLDPILRDLMTEMGGIDHCVTEFIRVTDKLIPKAVIERFAPELKTGSRTRSGVPLFLQFLGGQATPLAENAHQGSEMGALGIDLNFGCPAKTVNRHDGGASLLKCPDRVFNIISAVRKAVPEEKPVSAKIRLGFDDPSVCIEVAQAVEAAGASWLTIHCRTKVDGYRPPAYWEWIPKIKEKCKIEIVANGEINSVVDFWRCHQVTGCTKFMIGRAGIARPTLFREIKASVANREAKIENSWAVIRKVLPHFFEVSSLQVSPYFAQARTKQWLRAISSVESEARPLFDDLKVITDPSVFKTRLFSQKQTAAF